MSVPKSRAPILAGVTVLLVAVVVADRASWLASAGGGLTADGGARAAYLAAAAESSDERALVARAGEWGHAAARARAEWGILSGEIVRAATPELAEARFREEVLAAMEDIRLNSPARINYVRDGATAVTPAAPIRTLRLSVQFDAATPRDAYTIVDRLEHLSGARASVETLKIDGPGRVQLPEQVTVTLTLSTPAFIGEEAS